jgi:ACR3 family arsenite efflux pump ArsB
MLAWRIAASAGIVIILPLLLSLYSRLLLEPALEILETPRVST